MNRKIIQKIIDELNKETPKLDYLRGICEMLIETLPEEKIEGVKVIKQMKDLVKDESKTLDMEVNARLNNIKDIIKTSVETQ